MDQTTRLGHNALAIAVRDQGMRSHARALLGSALAAALLTTGCTDERPADGAGDSGSPPPSLRLTVLGDSNAHPTSCLNCTVFADQVAGALGAALGTEVEVVNLAWELSRPDPAEIADIADFVEAEGLAPDTLADSDAVLVLAFQNDLAYNRRDDPCGVAPAYPRVRWHDLTHACIDASVRDYGRQLERLLDAIDRLRAGRPTMLRIVSAYNTAIDDDVDPTWNLPSAIEPSTYNVARMADVQCRAAARHGGLCADAWHALNGRDGRRSAQRFLNPADDTHLTQRGHDVVARLVIGLGFDPLDDQA